MIYQDAKLQISKKYKKFLLTLHRKDVRKIIEILTGLVAAHACRMGLIDREDCSKDQAQVTKVTLELLLCILPAFVRQRVKYLGAPRYET